ncbi:hypothetical protein [Paenibacillus pinistramenti]|uniref:hypothetical protein n=1 Tax=Paenibacillus pinistramenti TaxID=1768003 RepID=UPI00110904F1|nr:hypothetical protein [Paenibacillus pinistramenti]
MNKIFIVGIVASGKTTLAKCLSEQLGLPWYELDCLVHYQTAEGRRKRTPAELAEVIKGIDRTGQWIFEGTDRGSYQFLYDMADTIIFLDPPLWKRRVRIFTRFLKQVLRLEKSHYKPDLQMLKMMYRWTSDFENKRNDFEQKLGCFKHKLIRLTDRTKLALEKSNGVNQ